MLPLSFLGCRTFAVGNSNTVTPTAGLICSCSLTVQVVGGCEVCKRDLMEVVTVTNKLVGAQTNGYGLCVRWEHRGS